MLKMYLKKKDKRNFLKIFKKIYVVSLNNKTIDND